jgi:hypothetical protein
VEDDEPLSQNDALNARTNSVGASDGFDGHSAFTIIYCRWKIFVSFVNRSNLSQAVAIIYLNDSASFTSGFNLQLHFSKFLLPSLQRKYGWPADSFVHMWPEPLAECLKFLDRPRFFKEMRVNSENDFTPFFKDISELSYSSHFSARSKAKARGMAVLCETAIINATTYSLSTDNVVSILIQSIGFAA